MDALEQCGVEIPGVYSLYVEVLALLVLSEFPELFEVAYDTLTVSRVDKFTMFHGKEARELDGLEEGIWVEFSNVALNAVSWRWDAGIITRVACQRRAMPEWDLSYRFAKAQVSLFELGTRSPEIIAPIRRRGR